MDYKVTGALAAEITARTFQRPFPLLTGASEKIERITVLGFGIVVQRPFPLGPSLRHAKPARAGSGIKESRMQDFLSGLKVGRI